MKRVLTGHCLCGAVTLRAETSVQAVHECHCTQCRRQSGHVWGYVDLRAADVQFAGPVATYAHSPRATRGFCADCGSFLFWRRNGSDKIDISAGILDAPTGLRMGSDSYPQFKGDYYDLDWLR